MQLAGLALGALLLYLATNIQTAGVVRVVLMLVGFLIIYDCCHAIAHRAEANSLAPAKGKRERRSREAPGL